MRRQRERGVIKTMRGVYVRKRYERRKKWKETDWKEHRKGEEDLRRAGNEEN